MWGALRELLYPLDLTLLLPSPLTAHSSLIELRIKIESDLHESHSTTAWMVTSGIHLSSVTAGPRNITVCLRSVQHVIWRRQEPSATDGGGGRRNGSMAWTGRPCWSINWPTERVICVYQSSAAFPCSICIQIIHGCCDSISDNAQGCICKIITRYNMKRSLCQQQSTPWSTFWISFRGLANHFMRGVEP